MKILTKNIYKLPSSVVDIIKDSNSIPYLEQIRVKEFSNRAHPVSGNSHVIIPWSGGLDSTVSLLMALESSKTVSTIFFDYGQSYADKELNAIESILEMLKVSDYDTTRYRQHVKLNISWLKEEMLNLFSGDWKHIFPMRNFVILMLAYESIDAENKEIWFSPVQGEIPYSGGDKSEIFIKYMSKLMQSYGTILKTPLSQLTKGDIVHWAKTYPDRMNIIKNTVSCFDGTSHGHCGKCQACFNRAVGFYTADQLENSGVVVDNNDLKPIVDLYKEKLKKNDYYSYRRKLEILNFIKFLKQ